MTDDTNDDEAMGFFIPNPHYSGSKPVETMAGDVLATCSELVDLLHKEHDMTVALAGCIHDTMLPACTNNETGEVRLIPMVGATIQVLLSCCSASAADRINLESGYTQQEHFQILACAVAKCIIDTAAHDHKKGMTFQ